jgi:hypothetical protein
VAADRAVCAVMPEASSSKLTIRVAPMSLIGNVGGAIGMLVFAIAIGEVVFALPVIFFGAFVAACSVRARVTVDSSGVRVVNYLRERALGWDEVADFVEQPKAGGSRVAVQLRDGHAVPFLPSTSNMFGWPRGRVRLWVEQCEVLRHKFQTPT